MASIFITFIKHSLLGQAPPSAHVQYLPDAAFDLLCVGGHRHDQKVLQDKRSLRREEEKKEEEEEVEEGKGLSQQHCHLAVT